MKLPLGNSLRARLLFFLLAAVLVAALVQGVIAYRSTLQQTDQIFDAQLVSTATSLTAGDGLLSATPMPAIDAAPADDLIIQIWTASGARLFKSRTGKLLPDPVVLGFSDVRVDASTYRVYAVATPFQVTQVAQDMKVRRDTARALALRTVGPIAAAAPLLMLVVWLVVGASLRPLRRTRAELAARQPEALDPVGESGLPDEILPLVRELNLLLDRTRRAFDLQKRFVGDAAHELRSPLAALRLQMQALQRPGDTEAHRVALQRLGSGIERASRLIEQLLSMARHDAAADALPAQRLDLGDVARQAIADVLPEANARGMDIGMDGAPQAWVRGNGDALALLLRNLLDNAIKYTPPGGRIDVVLASTPGGARLLVDDSGPGVPEAERERVFDRFYRLANHDEVGSGLGLSIVRAIAERHGATVRLDQAPELGGLRVEVDFPALS
ncbi:two-component sensor histidine kinase [Bordetella genomosp. 10]|uniref:histidine kinase n=1 Tax=Bordetella genomosp. 10 TaxID=1416804 RepID=A0A261RYX5_9BORD|nr:ATP-binding protein [Bordetella genomosp. 10]OZI30286.1 two-component sensor histidine kinase [Bordetella genomosp. 10]